MPQVKIRIYRGNDFDNKELVRTVYIDANAEKKLTGKRAGKVLANSFPEFDRLGTRQGLQKTKEGFLAMRPFEQKEKCNYHYFWEYALVTEDSE